jgi:(p)ppGpp synthase/HD superfamily hydrolase
VISRSDADAILVRTLREKRTAMGGAHVEHARRVARAATDAIEGSDDDHVFVAALLHDTLEKGAIVHDELASLVHDERVLELVDRLTHRADESDEDYLRRCAAHPKALAIKRADLLDKLGPQDVPVDPARATAVRAEARRKLSMLDRLTGN